MANYIKLKISPHNVNEQRIPPKSLSEKVRQLEEHYKSALTLLGEIIATLTLEQNQECFEPLPEVFHTCVELWEQRLQKLKGVFPPVNGDPHNAQQQPSARDSGDEG